MNKLIVILGPTSAGKTSLSIKLAEKFNGEVVSADSRQVYKGMNLGTGKVTEEEMNGIPHHLLNVVSPKEEFNVVQYQELAFKAIEGIQERDKLPFLVGGSPFYIYAVVEGWKFPGVPPKPKLREKLEKKSKESLFKILKKMDPERAREIDKNNKRRIIRSIEIAEELGEVPDLKKEPRYDSLLLGIKTEREKLEKLISERLERRFNKGMIQEVKKLHENGVTWEKLEEFGLEYRWIARFLQKKIPKKEMKQSLRKDIEHFAKRQMTWFKKDDRIHWIEDQNNAEQIIRDFLNK